MAGNHQVISKTILVGGCTLVSRVLGLELRVEVEMLRLVDPATGEKLLTPLEAQDARRRAEAERLRAELARLRTGERPLGKGQ